MLTELAGASKFLRDQSAFQTPADIFYLLWLAMVPTHAPQRIVKNSNEIKDVVLDVLRVGRSPTKHIEQLELKSQAMAQDDHVVGVQIPMVLALVVDRFDTQSERMQQVNTLKRV